MRSLGFSSLAAILVLGAPVAALAATVLHTGALEGPALHRSATDLPPGGIVRVDPEQDTFEGVTLVLGSCRVVLSGATRASVRANLCAFANGARVSTSDAQ
jgi:hypothetical protein